MGTFVGDYWKEWNGKFRDDVRSFLKGDNDTVAPLAERLVGSPDVYAHANRAPEKSVNFLTVHDGFTLNDVVSYNDKHNEANGEDNRDGANDNHSWNCGVEGPTDDPAVEALRERQVKNAFTLLLVAVGAPLFQMGDEVRRTQQGNNNAYCQDNEISWFDWTLLGQARRCPSLRQAADRRAAEPGRCRTDDDTLVDLLELAQLAYHDLHLGAADQSSTSHSLAISAMSATGRAQLYLIANAYWEPLDFDLPPAPVRAYQEVGGAGSTPAVRRRRTSYALRDAPACHGGDVSCRTALGGRPGGTHGSRCRTDLSERSQRVARQPGCLIDGSGSTTRRRGLCSAPPLARRSWQPVARSRWRGC